MDKNIVFNALAPVLEVYGDTDLIAFTAIDDVCTARFRLRQGYVEYDRCTLQM